MTLNEIKALIENDILLNDQEIIHHLRSDVVLINQIGHHIVQSGGKRIRPLLTMLSAKALGYGGKNHILAATIIEFIHTATLLHDDVVDHSTKRRGKETANALFGNSVSVLTGDFLYSRAFELMVKLDRMEIMQILSSATNKIAEGEVMQLMNCHNPDVTENRYFDVIYCKTGKLFEAACHIASVISNQEDHQAMINYGKYLGTAFQLADDVLDYTASEDELGKNLGDDLAEGKPTLPLIYAKSKAQSEEIAVIDHAIEHGAVDQISQITQLIQAYNGIDYTLNYAYDYANKAIESIQHLTPSVYKDALIALANLAVNRQA
ncbi:polyprenyl synthetase family protein [Thiotrichales bacterium 19S11-10]|nr:polyprenyl synthetase family protein [Thiotrichales bacterium 19S11-10]MCF6807462.1 polyprenyl synthetase family protein [Thiotrichales bacterium 19S9-11]MCF6811431.1 polyprenyl synthetase family protein [Thiotrichales bacterium 19S9-12]